MYCYSAVMRDVKYIKWGVLIINNIFTKYVPKI